MIREGCWLYFSLHEQLFTQCLDKKKHALEYQSTALALFESFMSTFDWPNTFKKGVLGENPLKPSGRFIKFKEKVTNRPLWSDKYFKHVEAIGLPFALYLQVYLIEQRDHFIESNLSGVAEELIAIACLSEETSSKTVDLVREWSEHIYSDLNLLTKLDIQVSKILMEFHRA